MPNQPMLRPGSDTTSHLRCPRTQCEDYHRHLQMEVGQDENGGHLTVRHLCPSCTYVEFGPSTPTAARRTSSTVQAAAARLRNLRLQGVVVPLAYTQDPFPEDQP
jgi:hypothetical protein